MSDECGHDRDTAVSVVDVLAQIDSCISVLSGNLTREMIGSGWNRRTRPEMIDFLERWRARIAKDGDLRSDQQTGVWRWLYEDSNFAESGGDVGGMITDIDRMIKAATKS
jgi:hypothetical protein